MWRSMRALAGGGSSRLDYEGVTRITANTLFDGKSPVLYTSRVAMRTLTRGYQHLVYTGTW